MQDQEKLIKRLEAQIEELSRRIRYLENNLLPIGPIGTQPNAPRWPEINPSGPLAPKPPRWPEINPSGPLAPKPPRWPEINPFKPVEPKPPQNFWLCPACGQGPNHACGSVSCPRNMNKVSQ